MAKQKKEKPGNGRKIIILDRNEVRKIFNLCAIAQAIWGEKGVSLDLLSTVVPEESRDSIWETLPCKMKLSTKAGRVTLANLEKEIREELRSNWPKKELSRFDKLGSIPVGDFAPVLCDTATLLKQRVDKSGIYFQEYDGTDEKDVTEVDTGLDFVLEIGSFGLAYNDENFYDARGYDLSLLEEDIVGDITEETLSYWKKRFEVPKQTKEFGEEFSFSPASLGTMLSKPNNIMRVDKWFQNGEYIFNVLMVFYTLNKKERVYTINPDNNSEFYENCDTVSVDVPYVDVQLNVYTDAIPTTEIMETITDTYKVQSNNMVLFIGKGKQLSLFDTATTTMSKRKNVAAVKANVLLTLFDRKETSMMRPGFGHSYRPKGSDMLLKDSNGKTVYETDEYGIFICSGNRKIGVPSKTEGLTRMITTNINKYGETIFEVLYLDEEKNIVFRNGKKEKKKLA